MASEDAAEKKAGFSFGFSKKKENKVLQKSVASDVGHKKEEETDFVYSLEGTEVKSSKPVESKTPKQLVIPLIKQNNWRTPYLEKIAESEESSKKSHKQDKKEENAGNITNDLTAQAAKEILESTALQNQNWEERGMPDTSLSVPLLVSNKVPEGFEADDGRLDVALRPDEPEDANYEEIPIDQFGFAMLRGMGWKDGEGIGKNKQVVAPLEAELRPKGLGLGANRSKAMQAKNGNVSTSDNMNGEEESLVLKKGAFCLITKGKNEGFYGIMEGIDEDNARVMLKLTLSGKTVTVSQYAVEIVSKKDYEKFSKYLNKAKVDKYKEEEGKKKERTSRDRSRSPSEKEKKRKSQRNRSRSPEDRKKHHRRSESPEEKYARKRKHKSDSSEFKHKHDEKKIRHEKESNRISSFLWVRPDIRVRIVDKKFKSGKYYKSKVVVIDVVSPDNCVCKTEEGKVLEGLSQSVLETVIPKTDHAHALIVAGKYRGQIGEVVKRSKEKCEALLQLLSDRDTVLRLGYDDICEYVGNIDHEFDY